MTQPHRTVLLTGFGPFSTVDKNPSQLLAEAMDDFVAPGWLCKSTVLDVSYVRSIQQLLAKIDETHPACVVMTGVARSASALRVERQAVNCASSLHADVDGDIGDNRPLTPEFPVSHTRHSTWDIESVLGRLNGAGFQMYDSTDAGGYVCNASYYYALGRVQVPVVFVHVPPTGPFWTPERLLSAFRVLVKDLNDLFPV
tara:strand:- start:23 stop:619 length:597 start_codon:yes stop_codon:yes gene_type:complete